MDKSPAELNRIWSRATQTAMEEKLGRKLTRAESDKIWNVGSFLRLESIDMAVYYAKSREDLEQYLSDLPTPDPIPEEYTRRVE